MRTFRRATLLAGLVALVASLTVASPANARTPTPSNPLPLRLEAGVHRGFRIDGSGGLVQVRRTELKKPATVTTIGRRSVPGKGIVLQVGSGELSGTWVREGALRHVPGRVGGTSLASPRTIAFPVDPVTGRRAYLGYHFDVAGNLTSTRPGTLLEAGTAQAARLAVINGRSYARMSDGPWAGWWMPVASDAAAGVLCRAGNRPSGSATVMIRRVAEAGTEIALTFDMGGRLDPAVAILERLLVERACTTVFPTGAAIATPEGAAAMAIVRAHPELFEVGNHTVHHCNLRDGGGGAACPDDRPTSSFVAAELQDAATAIKAATGQSPAPYWRPPYGAVDGALRAVAAAAGYPATVMWAVDTIDWRRVRDGGPTALEIAAKIRATPGGGIVLMHLGGYHTLDALPLAFAKLRADGRRPTSVSGLLD